MNRYVLTVNLKDDPAAIDAYRCHHARVWPEVVESLRRAGVRDMAIHLLGRQLVMIVDLDDGLDVIRVFAAHRASDGPGASRRGADAGQGPRSATPGSSAFRRGRRARALPR